MIARVDPWPMDRGSRIRVVSTVRALATAGAVDLVGLTSDLVSGVHDAPDGEPISQWHAIRMNIEPSSLVRSARLVLGAAPRALAVQNLAATRARLRTWTDQPYDLIWFYRAEALAIAKPAMGRPVVVDLDDLDYVKIQTNRGAIGETDGRRDRGFFREQAKHFVESREGPRWRALRARNGLPGSPRPPRERCRPRSAWSERRRGAPEHVSAPGASAWTTAGCDGPDPPVRRPPRLCTKS